MGLFSKKTCAICGASIGMLGNKKLADADMCKECCGKLSVWFDDRRNATLEDIKKQLSAREENKKQLDNFETTFVFGEFGRVLIDNNAKKFVALPTTSDRLFGTEKEVKSIDDIKYKNPDIIDFSQVTDIETKAKVTQNELKQTINGERVSYDPKRFEYMCNFEVIFKVNHPYINEMTVPLNDSPIRIVCDEPRRVTTYADEIRAAITGLKKRDYGIENIADYIEANSLKEFIFKKMDAIPDYSFGFKVDRSRNWRDIQTYHYFLSLGEEIKNIIKGE